MRVNAERARWFRRYQAALRKHLEPGRAPDLAPATKLGRQAMALGLETLDMAKVHTQTLITSASRKKSPGARLRAIERGKQFFAETIVPVEGTHRAALRADARVSRCTRTLRRRTTESRAATRCLKRSVLLRQGAEQALKDSGKRHSKLLAGLHHMQKHLRHLAHTHLSAQEDARRRMSLRLHDDIGQSLIAVDLRLLTLKKAAKACAASLKKEIAKTQQLVEHSGRRVHQFAREFGVHHGP